jgi:hypothetical protein
MMSSYRGINAGKILETDLHVERLTVGELVMPASTF